MKSLLATLVFAVPLLAAETGSITGTVDNPATVTAVSVVDRTTDKRFTGKIDKTSGEFVVDSLPFGAKYDCVVDFAGARLEGVDMKVPRSDYEEEQPLSAEDLALLREKTRSVNQFEDVVDILAITGNIQHAIVLVNKLRTTSFHSARPGEIIWRAEVWRFERPEETWAPVQEDPFLLLYRERIQRSVYDKKSVTFDPRLGGLSLTTNPPTINLGRIRLPATEPGIRVRSGKENQ